MTTASWLADRRQRITATDIPYIMGCNPRYGREPPKTLRQHMKEKISGMQIPPTLAMRFGTLYEDVHLRFLNDHCGLLCEPNKNLLIHNEHYWLGATPDGFVDLALSTPNDTVPWYGELPTFTSPLGLLEMKNTNQKMVGAEIPRSYWSQVQCQLAVAGLDEAVLFIKTGASSARLHRIYRDSSYIDKMIEKSRNVYMEYLLPLAPIGGLAITTPEETK